VCVCGGGGGRGTPYNGVCRKGLPPGGSFFRVQVFQRVGITLCHCGPREVLNGLTGESNGSENGEKTS